jgi:hypothetical protein
VELYRPNRSKQKSKIEEGLSDNQSNWMKKQTSNLKELSYQDRQYSSDWLQFKAAHIPGRINVATDKLRRLEMSGDYHLKKEVFQMIQWRWKYFPKIDLFASKLNMIIKIYASIIPRKDPDNIKNALRLD